MIVAIDGPAGAGKSTAARRLAERLGFAFLDTGAMYRAVALAALRAGADWSDAATLAALADDERLRFDGPRVWIGDEEATEAIRAPETTAVVGRVADVPEVRAVLVRRQRRCGEGRDLVTEGRDQATVVFPDAACKIYLTASATERARRRWEELRTARPEWSLEDVLADQQRRDAADAMRPVGALRRAPDAIELPTDGLALDEVVDAMERLVRARRASPS